MMRKRLWLTPFFALSIAFVPGCGSDDADADATGGACEIVDIGDGNSAIRCPDGSELIVKNGKDGAPGEDGTDGNDGADGANGKDAESPCSLAENGDGTHTLTCGDKSVTIGDDCEGGFQGDLEMDDESLTLFQVTSCTWIRGSVYIEDYEEEKLPKAFARITKIDGDLYVGGNAELTNVAFPALAYVGWDLKIENNLKLSTIGDFSALETLWGVLHIAKNPKLVSIGDFPELETAVTWITFSDNAELESIGSFDSLVALERFHGITWENNPSLVDMGSFPALESVYLLHVVNNASLESLSVFSSLKTVQDLRVIENAELISVAGFPSLESVTGELTIWENPSLPQCHALEVFADVSFEPAYASIGKNDSTATCP